MPDHMPDHMPDAVPLRTRNLLHMDLDNDDDGFIAVDHVYLPEGAAGVCCQCDKPAHDPGMVGLIVSEGQAVITAEQALTLAHRLIRAADLIHESEEEPADLERDLAKYGAPAEPTATGTGFDPVKQAVWAAWNALPDDDPSPVKRIARDLNMTAAAVAAIVYPAHTFGYWADDHEPDLDQAEGEQ